MSLGTGVHVVACCRTLRGIAGKEMLCWGGDRPQEQLQGLLHVVSRLLQPNMGDSASLHIGSLIHQLLLKLHAEVSLQEDS